MWALDRGQGYLYPLTQKGQMSSKYLPGKEMLLTGFDNDCDENWQIYALSSDGGELVPVLSNPREKFYFGDVSVDGQVLYFYTSEDNRRYQNIARLDLRSGGREITLQGQEGPVRLLSVSPDQASFAYGHSLGNTKDLGYIRIGEEDIAVTPETHSTQRVHGIKYFDHDTVYQFRKSTPSVL